MQRVCRRAHTAARIAASIRLPRTTFPRRALPADALRFVPQISSDLYEQISISADSNTELLADATHCGPKTANGSYERVSFSAESNTKSNAKAPFVIHDGPPFANGRLHIGHALNKLAKDALLRSRAARERRVVLVPAWDCHGLPIEVRALTAHITPLPTDAAPSISCTDGIQTLQSELSNRSKNAPLTAKTEFITNAKNETVALLDTCRAFAENAVGEQSAQMRSWGLLADANRRLRTMDPAYEAAELRVLARIVRRGLLSPRKQPVLWSPSSRTALAEAEVVYGESTDTACLFAFALADTDAQLLVWTTTPWTLFANEGVAFAPHLAYVTVRHAGRRYVVAECRVPFVAQTLGTTPTSDDFVVEGPFALVDGMLYTCSVQLTSRPVVSSAHVSEETGTGLVHCAPSFGYEDHVLWQSLAKRAFALPPPSPETVDDSGLLTAAAGYGLAGTSIFDAAVLSALHRTGALVLAHAYTHRVPRDWRTGGRVIERATRQWFLDVAAVRPTIHSALAGVAFVPESGRTRLKNMLDGRDFWCVSRQRRWGLPLPVFYRASSEQPKIVQKRSPMTPNDDDSPSESSQNAWRMHKDGDYILSPEVIEHVAGVFEHHGSAAWWSMPLADLLPPRLRPLAPSLVRGTDTLDVWLDSGCLWAAMPLAHRTADVYVEGTDQFRGWFQAALITSACAGPDPLSRESSCASIPTDLVIADAPVLPMRAIVAHGFVLDGSGIKMSKSVGNVVAPEDVIARHGLDVLRLWAASSFAGDAEDAVLCESQLAQTAAGLSRMRNTLAFILGNLSDTGNSAECLNALRPIDEWAVASARRMASEAYLCYEAFNLRGAHDILAAWLRDALSAFYIDAVRDRLYVGDTTGRAAAQCGLRAALNAAVHVLDPIAPLLCAELREHAPADIHAFGTFAQEQCLSDSVFQRVEKVRLLRRELMAFGLGRTGHPMARHLLVLDRSLLHGLSPEDCSEALSVGQVVARDSLSNSISVDASNAPYGLLRVGRIGPADVFLLPADYRCERCQRYYAESVLSEDICRSCHVILNAEFSMNHAVN